MNLDLLHRMINDGYVVMQKHPTEELFIYNYSASAQYERVWNEVTLQCRGLILNSEKEIIARPFPKFFNYEELESHSIPNENFEVYEKLDGSLGILYFVNDKPCIATRGSFASEQAIFATELLHSVYKDVIRHLNSNHTYLFEIIYPENRIVVDYGDAKELRLLAIIETYSGKDLPLVDIGFPIVTKYDGVKDFHALKQLNESNKEGFVIKFENGFRFKLKFEDYVYLHKIITGISSTTIWESLSNGEDFKAILEKVPDEFYDWVKKTEQELRTKFREIESVVKREYKTFDTRKEAAAYFLTCTYPSILFKMLDGKPYDNIIWKLVKPKFSKPFNNSEE